MSDKTDKQREIEKVIKEVKRACPIAIEMATYGADPIHLHRTKGVKLKRHIRKLLTKYSKLCFHGR